MSHSPKNAPPAGPAAPFLYRFGPFAFTSELAIPELQKASGLASIPVRVRTCPVPADLPGAAHFGALCRVSPGQYLLDIPGVARYLVQNGNDVQIEIHPGAPPADVSGFLLGSAFGALCHQNRLLPLHASAVAVGGEVTAFLGESGAGKSTLAACLQSRGHPIVSDDICVLEPGPVSSSAPHPMRVIPVAGWLKLWRASLDHLGKVPEERNRVFQADSKYRLYLEPGIARLPLLRNIVFLHRAAGSAYPPTLEPLATPHTIAGMMRLTYLGYITELTGSHARIFGHCAQALGHARGFRLTVPWDFGNIDAVLDLLEAKLLRPPATSG